MNVRRLLSRTARLSSDHYPFRDEPDRAPDCSIHLYGGDFSACRAATGSGRPVKQPCDVQKTLQLFRAKQSPLREAARS